LLKYLTYQKEPFHRVECAVLVTDSRCGRNMSHIL